MEMSPFLHLAFFKTILPALFRTFGLPSRFWPSKPSFLHDHFTTQHSDFSIFLSVPITDKPVNRSIHAYALTWLNVFVLRGLSFLIFTKKMEGVRAIQAIKYKKKAGKYPRACAPLAWKNTNPIFESKDGATSTQIVN